MDSMAMVPVHITWRDRYGKEHTTRVHWTTATVAAIDHPDWLFHLARRELMGDQDVWYYGGARQIVAVEYQ